MGLIRIGDVDPVQRAATMARRLLDWVWQGPDDSVPEAFARAETRFRIPQRTLWALRYRPPKDLGVRMFFRIAAAYERECERQEKKLEIELDIAQMLPPSAARQAHIRETEALLRSLRAERIG